MNGATFQPNSAIRIAATTSVSAKPCRISLLIDQTGSPHLVSRYHMVHLYLLHALYSLTGKPVLDEYLRRWEETVS